MIGSVSKFFEGFGKKPKTTETLEFSLAEEETRKFLLSNGAKNIKNFKPGRPIFYVLDEQLRNKIKTNPPPSFVVVHNPTDLDLEDPLMDNVLPNSEVIFSKKIKLRSKGKVTFYAINPETEQIKSVLKIDKSDAFATKEENLFEIPDKSIPDPELNKNGR